MTEFLLSSNTTIEDYISIADYDVEKLYNVDHLDVSETISELSYLTHDYFRFVLQHIISKQTVGLPEAIPVPEQPMSECLMTSSPAVVKDIFESSGAIIRTDKPQLTIEGRIGDGRYLWNSPAMWYRDAPIFVVSVCTIGMVMSKERENNVSLLVYNQEGKRLKEYHAAATYHTIGFGLPFAYLVNDKIRAWYCDRMAAKFALIQCVNEFIRDCNNGFYKK